MVGRFPRGMPMHASYVLRAVYATSRTMKHQTRHGFAACCLERMAGHRPCVVGLCQELRSAEPPEATIAEEVVPQPCDDELDAIERMVGYMFRNRDLLRRAFWCAVVWPKCWVVSPWLCMAWVAKFRVFKCCCERAADRR